MRRRTVFALMLTLVAIVAALSVRLYQTTRRLEKAEQYMVSGMLSWVGLCAAIAGDVRSLQPARVHASIDLLSRYCLSADDAQTLDDLVAKGENRDALSFAIYRLYEYRLPRIVERSSYDSRSFPAGYP